MEPTAKNLCLFTGQLRSFRVMLVGEYKDIPWGFGRLFLPENKTQGQEINIQAWADNAERLAELDYNTWIKVSSVFCPSTYKGKEQANFVVGNFTVLQDVNQSQST